MLIHHDVFHIFREPHIFASTLPGSPWLSAWGVSSTFGQNPRREDQQLSAEKMAWSPSQPAILSSFHEGCPGGKQATLQLQRLQKNLIKKMDKYTLVSYGQNSGISRMRGEQQTWRMAHFSAVLAKISWVSSECASQPRAIKQRLRSTRQLTS